MRYFGGKARISKRIADFLNSKRNESVYWEPFCGSCWVAQHIDARYRLLSDANPELVEMWKHLQQGWVPPRTVSKQLYDVAREGQVPDHLMAFIGFGCSWGGKWFGGYARSSDKRNYAANARNSLVKKISNLQEVMFFCKDYKETPMDFPVFKTQIYCDPPYKGTTQCDRFGKAFNTEMFWKTVREWSKHGHDVYVSEYVAPPDFTSVLEIPTKTDVRMSDGTKSKRIERLFVYEH